jgi:hypothetical protein
MGGGVSGAGVQPTYAVGEIAGRGIRLKCAVTAEPRTGRAVRQPAWKTHASLPTWTATS